LGFEAVKKKKPLKSLRVLVVCSCLHLYLPSSRRRLEKEGLVIRRRNHGVRYNSPTTSTTTMDSGAPHQEEGEEDEPFFTRPAPHTIVYYSFQFTAATPAPAEPGAPAFPATDSVEGVTRYLMAQRNALAERKRLLEQKVRESQMQAIR
jgi:hypothetical protein